MRWRATAMDTAEVSMAIQRRPQRSAVKGIAPEPQVGSRTRSPGSVVMSRTRRNTSGGVSTMYGLSIGAPMFVHTLVMLRPGISSAYLINSMLPLS